MQSKGPFSLNRMVESSLEKIWYEETGQKNFAMTNKYCMYNGFYFPREATNIGQTTKQGGLLDLGYSFLFDAIGIQQSLV